MKKIVVLGAGYAGVLTAKKLAKKTKKANHRVDITLIDKNPFHTMLTELHEVAAGRVEEDSIRINLDKVFAGRNVNLVQDKITNVDFKGRTLTGDKDVYKYDYLVMAAGSKPNFFGLKDAEANCFTLWSYDDAVKLRDHIHAMFRLASAEYDEAKKREILTFYIVGTGLTGVEMAGELAEYAPILCRRFDIDPGLVTITAVDMLDRVCPVLPEKLSAKVRARLEKMGVTVMLKTSVRSVGQDYIECGSDNWVTSVPTRTVIWAAGITGSEIVHKSESLARTNSGRVKTNEYLQALDTPNVYVAGDNIHYVPEGEKTPVPQMVENAEHSAHTVAHNLMADITGTGKKEKYTPRFHGAMVCVGGRWGTAHVGPPGKFFALPSFLAMLSKHFINMIYFLQVLGWHKIISYMRHEFFTIRNKRSFVGGHFSNRNPSFLLVPLRLFLGFIWVYEGVKKVGEGWMSTPRMSQFFLGARQWYESLLAGGTVAEATSAATPVATAAATPVAGGGGVEASILIDWTIFGIFRPLLITAPQEAFLLQIVPLDWFLINFILPSEGLQLFMQIMIVTVEILIGLALMAGLFTTLSGAVSLGLQVLFLTSTGLYMSTWWMVPASIAVMFGAGLVFGLDYYVSPWLKVKWRNTRFAKKWYLYHE